MRSLARPHSVLVQCERERVCEVASEQGGALLRYSPASPTPASAIDRSLRSRLRRSCIALSRFSTCASSWQRLLHKHDNRLLASAAHLNYFSVPASLPAACSLCSSLAALTEPGHQKPSSRLTRVCFSCRSAAVILRVCLHVCVCMCAYV